MIAILPENGSLGKGLRCRPADARDPDDRLMAGMGCPIHLLGGQLEQRSKQPKLRVADGELSRVNPHRQPASAGCKIIAKQSSLTTLIETALGRQGQRTRGNDKAASQGVGNSRIESCGHRF